MTRREFLAKAAAVGAGAAAVPLLQMTPALATGSCTLGVWSPNIPNVQSAVGTTFRGVRYNQGMQSPLPTTSELRYVSQGHWMIYRNNNAQTRGAHGAQVCISWRSIASGAHDSYFRTGAQNLLRSKQFTSTHPYLYSFNHEQVVNNRHQCGGRAGGTAADYIAAYRRIRNIFNNAGATVSHGGNVRFVWTPTASQFRVPDGPYGAPHVDPGPDYYDYVGADAYNRRTGSGLQFTAPSQMLGAAHAYAKNRGKRLIIPEYGIEDGPTLAAHNAKAKFIVDTASLIQSWGATGPGSVYAWMFTSLDSYSLNSSGPVLAAAKKVVGLPFFI